MTRAQDGDSAPPNKGEQRRQDQERESLRAQVRGLEQDLAQTKLQMVEAKCEIQVNIELIVLLLL